MQVKSEVPAQGVCDDVLSPGGGGGLFSLWGAGGRGGGTSPELPKGGEEGEGG